MRRWLKVACLPAVAALLAAPALAIDTDDEGFYVAVAAALATPGNTNTAVAAESPIRGGLIGEANEADIVWTDWGHALSPGLGFGYSWGERGSLQVTFWEYSDDTREGGVIGMPPYSSYTWWTIGPMSAFSSFVPLRTMEFDFTQEIDASTIDVEYLLSLSPAESLDVTWGFGLRLAQFEDRVEGDYLQNPNSPLRSRAFRKVESDGIGLTGRVGLEHRFTELIGVRSDLRVGFLTAEVEARQAMDILLGGGYRVSEEQTIEDETAVTVDFDLSGRFRISDRVDLDVGWFYTAWGDMAQVPLSRSDLRDSSFSMNIGGVDIPGENRDRITWSGPRVAVDIKIGR